MKQGYVKLHRKIQDHWTWNNPHYHRAWNYLVMRANHKSNSILLGDHLVEVKRGQLVTSIAHLSEIFEMSPKRTRTFLKRLVNEGMIVKESTPNWSKITICNYDVYQVQGQAEDTQGAHKGHTRGKQGANRGQQTIMITMKTMIIRGTRQDLLPLLWMK
ncbi:MAG TPA: hypothetical protein ENH85_10520 [Candidatus Scalindua sp.]|nr:hypothetical protein [Candidatus Scalindua sp.]